jgi:hypothetical protein
MDSVCETAGDSYGVAPSVSISAPIPGATADLRRLLLTSPGGACGYVLEGEHLPAFRASKVIYEAIIEILLPE